METFTRRAVGEKDSAKFCRSARKTAKGRGNSHEDLPQLEEKKKRTNAFNVQKVSPQEAPLNTQQKGKSVRGKNFFK